MDEGAGAFAATAERGDFMQGTAAAGQPARQLVPKSAALNERVCIASSQQLPIKGWLEYCTCSRRAVEISKACFSIFSISH